ncbi:MAG TPA: autotransporter outer membrane beta-barrel domain-containing protein [Desulfobacterales bacterium]|nr:autotransporter outer membrane beta-barrel domain-containing protein [Desulfobacterales bacterium]
MKMSANWMRKRPLLGRFWIGLAVCLLPCAVPLAPAADYTLSYTGLHDGESVYGIDASSASSPFVNSDNYSLTAAGDDSGSYANVSFQAYGIYTSAAGPGIENLGDITVTAHGGTGTTIAPANALGIYSDSGDPVINSGDITATAIGGTAATAATASASGIYMDSFGTVNNTGDITATAIGGTAATTASASAYGIYLDSGGTVTNSGNITVTAIGGTAATASSSAYGIYLGGDSTLTSTGVIRTFADSAYEVRVASGTTTLKDRYNLNLDGDPGTGSIYVAAGAGLDLNDSDLTLSSVGESFRWNTEYQIFDNNGTITGNFDTVSALNPNVAVTYHDQSTATGADDTVSIAYRPIASPFLEGFDLLRRSVTMTGGMVDDRLSTYFFHPDLAAGNPTKSRLYAEAGNVATDGSWNTAPNAFSNGFFLTPYYADIDKDTSPAGYESDAIGFVTGYERRNDNHLYGFHLGIGHNELDFTGNGFSGNKEDQDVLTAGVHAMGSLYNWTWRGQVTGFYGWHDYEGLTGVGLQMHESADYESSGTSSNLMGGYLFKLGSHRLLPEAGLNHLWLRRDSFTTDADDANWDANCSSLDEHQLTAVASLRWLTRIRTGGVLMTPSVAAGVRYLLTGDEIDAHQSVAGSAPITVKSDQDDLTGTASASLLFSMKSNLSMELAYNGEYGDETTAHSAWLRFHYLF